MNNRSVLKLSFIALFAAVISIGSFIRIPIGFVPIVFQNALCVLCAVILGGVSGASPTLLFLAAGLIGLPVYSGGASGIGVWTGPTGGFFPGYLLGALVAGIIAGKPSVTEKKASNALKIRITLALVTGMALLYIPGAAWFAFWALKTGNIPEESSAFTYAMSACVIPFLPGDLVKLAVCLPIALKIRPLTALYLNPKKQK